MDRPFPSTRAFPGVLQALALLAGAFALMLAFGCGAGAVQMALGSPPSRLRPRTSSKSRTRWML